MSSDEWSIGIGLRRALVHLVIWGIAIAVAWGALLMVIAPWINQIPVRGRGVFLVYGLIAALPGVAAGYLMFHRMQERAGFTSQVLSGLALVFVWGALVAGGVAADSLRSLEGGRGGLLIVMAGLIATVEIIYETFADR